MTPEDIIITRQEGAWTYGRIGGFDFEVKHFDQPSVFGIDEGRISKLWIASRVSYRTVASYDRGWDKLPRFDNEIEATQAVIDRFN